MSATCDPLATLVTDELETRVDLPRRCRGHSKRVSTPRTFIPLCWALERCHFLEVWAREDSKTRGVKAGL